MNLLEEFRKALRGDPDAKVTLAPIPPDELAVERKLKAKGYEFAFGNGFPSRKDFVEFLPWLPESDDDPMTLDQAIAHCEEKIVDPCAEESCKAEHRQLANWLIELRNLRALVKSMREKE